MSIITKKDIQDYLSAKSKTCKYIIDYEKIAITIICPSRWVRKVKRYIQNNVAVTIHIAVYSNKNKKIRSLLK